MGDANCEIKEMRLSSYQILKRKMLKAKEEADFLRDDLESLILQPYSSRAKNVRTEIKIKHDI